MRIAGFQKTSFIDYPEKISAIIFTPGCNFHCGYCHNPELNNINSEKFDENKIIDFLNTRKNKLDGIVITGGEPTLQKDLDSFIYRIKELGFLVKLDTNGTNPTIIKTLTNKKLIDYIAMDIKAPLEKYSDITKTIVNTEEIAESINFIMNSDIDYEFRTTIVKSQLNSNDFEKIGELIKGSKIYYLQKFIPTKLLDNSFMTAETYSDDEFKNLIQILKKNIDKVELR